MSPRGEGTSGPLPGRGRSVKIRTMNRFPATLHFFAALGVCLHVFASVARAEEFRTLTNTSGKAIRAKVLAVAGGKVSIALENGQQFEIPLASLSPADQESLANWKPAPAPAAGGGGQAAGQAKKRGAPKGTNSPAAVVVKKGELPPPTEAAPKKKRRRRRRGGGGGGGGQGGGAT